VDLLPIITEQINPQHQFTATIQIPSHGLQVDVQLNNQKKKKKEKEKRIDLGLQARAFQQGSNKRFQWARQPDRWGVGGWWAAGTTRVGGRWAPGSTGVGGRTRIDGVSGRWAAGSTGVGGRWAAGSTGVGGRCPPGSRWIFAADSSGDFRRRWPPWPAGRGWVQA
jgi:hypothetical protein